MVKIFFTYSTDAKEGHDSRLPGYTNKEMYQDGSVDEIIGDNVIEKVPNLVAFIEECYRLLKPGGKAVFTSPHYSSGAAWASPLVVRGVCESTLNFSSKEWRTQYKFSEVPTVIDFEVTGQMAVDQDTLCRNDEAKAFWMKRFTNVVQHIILTLVKK
jgi:SAM-dependent methyltransferase